MEAVGHYDHVVLISIDTLRSDALSVCPHPLWPGTHPGVHAVDTAVLDSLARSGAYFPNVISAAPYTAASHGAIFTGQFPLHSGVHEFYNGTLRAPTVFTYGRRAGRSTILKTDFPIILGPELGFTRDLDTYLVEDDDGFIEAVADAESSVACAHFGAVHTPYGFHNLAFGGDAYREKVRELEAGLPESLPFADLLVESYRDPEDTDLLVRYKRAVAHLHSQGEYERLLQLYLDGVEHFLKTRFEPFLERLTERVAAAGQTMLLAVFADHGEEFAQHTNGHFNSMAEAVLRVPLIIAGDGIVPGVHSDRIRTVDIAPTLLDLAGIPTAATGVLDGRSLAAVARGEQPLAGDAPALAEAYTSKLNEFVDYQRLQLSGGKPEPLEHFLVGHSAYLDDRRVVRLTRRYSQWFLDLDESDQSWVERFDENRVPHREPGADPSALLSLLEDYRTALKDSEPVPVSDEMRAQLRALGYAV